MSEHALTWLDVFTSTPLAGNGLAVVHDADALSDETMLAFARETKLSETTFVQSGDGESDYRNRIWMTTGELPMAGHPSLGTAVAVAHVRGESSARYVQRTGAGLQPVEVELDGRVARASMLQEPARFGDEIDLAGLAEISPELPAQIVSCGVPQLIAPVASAEALDVSIDAGALGELLERTGAITLYLAHHDGAGHADCRSYFLSQTGTLEEDPATGSAAGPLMAYLHARAGVTELSIDQGVAMGRPSRLDCSLDPEGPQAGDRVRVGGETVIVATGSVHL